MQMFVSLITALPLLSVSKNVEFVYGLKVMTGGSIYGVTTGMAGGSDLWAASVTTKLHPWQLGIKLLREIVASKQ